MRTKKLPLKLAGATIGSVILLLLAWAAVRATMPDQRSIELRSNEQKVPAEALLAAYQSNELATERQLGTAPLIVSGTVGMVDLRENGDLSITLVNTQERVIATAAMLESSWQDADRLSHGETISLRCGSAMLVTTSLMLSNCVLTK